MLILHNRKGLTIIGTVVTLLILSVIALTAANLLTISQTLMSVEAQKERARMIAMAGIEYGLKTQVSSTVSFAGGQFAVTKSGQRVSSVGTYGDASATYSADIPVPPTQASCFDFDSTDAEFNEKKLTGLSLFKKSSCSTSVTVSSITISWVVSKSTERMTKIEIGGATVYPGTSGGAKSGVTVAITPTSITTTPKTMDVTWKSNLNSGAETFTFVFKMSDGSSTTAYSYYYDPPLP